MLIIYYKINCNSCIYIYYKKCFFCFFCSINYGKLLINVYFLFIGVIIFYVEGFFFCVFFYKNNVMGFIYGEYFINLVFIFN